MSGLSAGLATFNSCNKAGSIPHFNQHLSRYPSDYQALIWRGRAHNIIGNTADAKKDFQKALSVSSGPQKLLTQALIEHIDGNMEQKGAFLQNTTMKYPLCSEAWYALGDHSYDVEKKVDLSLQYLEKANYLAITNSETGEPWYPWCNQTIGNIYLFEKGQVHKAREHYETAVQSSKTFTIGHLGLSRCDILSNDIASAKTSFYTAKNLNPVLVDYEFDKFRQAVQQKHTQVEASMASKQRGNGGSSYRTADESLTREQRDIEWKKIKKEAPAAKTYRGKRFFQSKCKAYWYSKIDEAERHGREVKSFLKKYVDRGRTIELVVSLDENMKEMTGKHESGKYDVIKKSDMANIHK